jgi:hypothetical protein
MPAATDRWQSLIAPALTGMKKVAFPRRKWQF